MRMFHLEPVKPIYAKARTFITFVGVPDRNIGLLHQIFQRAIAAVIIDNEEVINALVAIIFEKIRQPDLLVAHGGETENIILLHLRASV